MRRVILPMAAVGALAAPAHAARDIAPYIEVQQVLDADLTGGGDVLTYTSIAAGVDATVSNRRIETGISYRYERRIPWNNGYGQDDIHSGLARGSLRLIPNTLTFDAGAIATRARSDVGAISLLSGDDVTQVYGFYAGPTFSSKVGPLQVGASYQFGYVKVEDQNSFLFGDRLLDSYDSSTSHMLNASVGMKAGELPFGWTVSGGYQREDTSELDQRYEAKFVRGDVTVPVSPTVALTAGAGYEDIRQTERAALLDEDGVPVTDNGGRLVTDPDSPRLLAYDQDGLIWDVGVIWQPSRRTTLQLRGGRRYGDWAVTGSLEYQISPSSGLSIGIYNGVDSFGRSLTRSLGALPTSFTVARNPFTGDFNGCVFGPTPGSSGCFDNALQAIGSANYRSRGINFLYSAQRGPWRLGVGGGYAQRKYLANIPGRFLSIAGVTDESWTINGSIARELSARSTIDFTADAAYYDSGIAGAADFVTGAASSSYYHQFGERLRGQASVGLSAYDQESFETYLAAQLLLGMRYQF